MYVFLKVLADKVKNETNILYFNSVAFVFLIPYSAGESDFLELNFSLSKLASFQFIKTLSQIIGAQASK